LEYLCKPVSGQAQVIRFLLIDSYEDGSEIVQLSNSSSLTSFRSTGKMNLSLASIPGVQLDIRYRPFLKRFAE